jgi:hypothetical protein
MLRCVVFLFMLLLTPLVLLAQISMEEEYKPHEKIVAEYRVDSAG